MTITLLALSLNDSPLSQPITATFDARGGTIGRADHNTMALPDPERHISRLQAEVRLEGRGFKIKNVGAANPISVGGRQLSTGEASTLSDGDMLRIGGYLLRVVDDALGPRDSAPGFRPTTEPDDTSQPPTSPGVARRFSAPAATPNPPSAPRAMPSVAPRSDVRNDELGAPLSSDNPFADLLGGSGSAGASGAAGAITTGTARRSAPDPFADLLSPPAGVTAGSGALGSPAAQPPAPILPDDFDPFAAPAVATPQSPPAAPRDPFEDLRPSGPQQTIDQMFDLGPRPDANEALDRFASGLPAESGRRRTEGGIPTDPLELLGGAPASPGLPDVQARDHTPNLRAAFDLPPPAAPRRSATPERANGGIPSDVTWLRPRSSTAVAGDARREPPAPPPAPPETPVTPAPPAEPPVVSPERSAAPPVMAQPPPAPPAPAHGDALWRAFCEGAAIQLELPRGLDEQTMHSIGRVLQAAVAGTLQLIAVRASTKQEMRADVTMIQARSNNPLKFAPDPQTGLEQLLSPAMRGFLPGPEAMQDAMADLVGHSIGTMTGMRAALEGMLARFAPEELEAKLSDKSLLDSLLPMNRKARLWDLYRQHFGSIREEAQEDFQALFGKAFLAAYEEQVERLKSARDVR